MLKKKLTTLLIGSAATIAISSLLIWGYKKQPPSIEPKITYTVQDRFLKNLPNPFEPLEETEKETLWGSEYLIGMHFAKNLDFYRAITAFRRAEILTPNAKRKLEVQYEILLNYYLGRRYKEVEQTFDTSELSQITPNFPPFKDLLLILYDTYLHLGETKKSLHILNIIHSHDPSLYKTITQYTALKKGDLETIKNSNATLYKQYIEGKKSPKAAALLNALLPGSGYFYLGQIQTAVTALLMNGLFIAATVYFFRRRPIAAAIIFLGFEAGWYFGGIQGALEQGKFYNERIYEQIVIPYMNHEGIFPIHQIKHAF